jgi:PPM family protein phosphatase
MHLTSSGRSICGRRATNQDALCEAPPLGLFAVADGMGGYEGGEVASSLTVAAIEGLVERCARDPEGTWPVKARRPLSPDENLLRAAVVAAHQAIGARREGALSQMGSTVVAVLVRPAHLVVAHVGDSRLYRLRGERVEALTRDHSLWAELAAQGPVGPRASFPYRNVITRALGLPGSSEADVATHAVEPGDRLLLCSDGLYDPLDDARLAASLRLAPEVACEHLVQAAFDAGSTDNITALVVACD